MPDANSNALTTIIDALKPLPSEERRRVVSAAMVFLGEKGAPTIPADPAPPSKVHHDSESDGSYSSQAVTWMKQQSVSEEELERVFHFEEAGGFVIHDVPGKSSREKTLNTYTLTGLGAFLTANVRTFDDATSRGFCRTLGCFDKGNHAKFLKGKHPDFTGDKGKGYSLTNPGLKRGAALVKQLAGAA
jgi:hypothetical protein